MPQYLQWCRRVRVEKCWLQRVQQVELASGAQTGATRSSWFGPTMAARVGTLSRLSPGTVWMISTASTMSNGSADDIADSAAGTDAGGGGGGVGVGCLLCEGAHLCSLVANRGDDEKSAEIEKGVAAFPLAPELTN